MTDVKGCSVAQAILLIGLTGCGSGRDGGSGGFELLGVSVAEGQSVLVDGPIELGFSAPVDFSTVGAGTISIQSDQGRPALGSFSLRAVDADGDGLAESVDDTVVVFQPACPLRADLSDAGLEPGGVAYSIQVRGGVANSVRARDGRVLARSVTRRFRTAAAASREDPVAGPPSPVVRAAGSQRSDATYFELGGDPDRRVYLEQGTPLATALPLNLFSDEATRVALHLFLDQPVDPAPENLGAAGVRFEYLAGGVWRPLETSVELLSNCGTGAELRLEPTGVLPSGGLVRVALQPGFRDRAGEALGHGLADFAVAPTIAPRFASLAGAGLGDEYLAELVGGTNGGLRGLGGGPLGIRKGDSGGATDPPCSGGPGGNFDWVVRDGETFFFDTTSTTIVGGPGGVPTAIQTAKNGVVEVRDLIVEQGGQIRVQGPNPFRVCATREVIVRGEIDLSGFRAKDVATLNTGHQPEMGAAGGPGGGRGGNSSEVTNQSTPQGGTGQNPDGAFTGGAGGESGYARAALGKDARRPGGGGGGRFAADTASLMAEDGKPGAPEATGAITGLMPPFGGPQGQGPFVDGDPTNDFYGVAPVTGSGGGLVGLVRGELASLWGGEGGGGGGDAIPARMFPPANWNQGHDEKGGAGGGGGGAAKFRALGRIVFGRAGVIRTDGGLGATGENTLFLDHVGGTGGSGSGGHVLLEAPQIDFTDGDPAAAPARAYVQAEGAVGRIGPTAGGIPTGISHGGAGGPGVLQLHAPFTGQPPSPDLTAPIVIPVAAAALSNPLDGVGSPAPLVLLAGFDRRTVTTSEWIPTAGAGIQGNEQSRPLAFAFGGVETAPGEAEGRVRTRDGIVEELAPLLGPAPLVAPDARIRADGTTLQLSGGALAPLRAGADDVYLRTPSLLRHFGLRLAVGSDARDYDVVAASYDDARGELRLTVAEEAGGTFTDFAGQRASVRYSLIPRFFRVRTDGVADRLPDGAEARILFQGAGEGFQTDWTAEPATFGALAPGELSHFRFRLELEVDALQRNARGELSSVSVDFLRVPFRF